jgi:hypothetical protein
MSEYPRPGADGGQQGAGNYYARHIFFCLNERPGGEDCCALHGAKAGFDHCKRQVKQLGLAGKGQVRVNKAGCLDRCAGAPVAVVYPEGTWYTSWTSPTSTRSSSPISRTDSRWSACCCRPTWGAEHGLELRQARRISFPLTLLAPGCLPPACAGPGA